MVKSGFFAPISALCGNSDSDSVPRVSWRRGTSSKDNFSSQLHLSGGCRGGVQQPGGSRGLLVEAESPPEGVIIGGGLEVRVVEDIESFHSQLQVERLRDTGKTNIFDEGKINIDQARADELVAPLIALDIQAEHLASGGRCSTLVAERRDR